MSLATASAAMLNTARRGVRVGLVESVDPGTGRCTIALAGASIEGLPWAGPTPVVGRSVTVTAGVVRMLSAPPVMVPDPVTVVVPRLGSIRYWNETVGDSPPPRPPQGWDGPLAFESGDDTEMMQGNAPLRGDTADPTYDPGVVWQLAMAVWADPGPLIPAGASDPRLLLRVRRTPLWDEPMVSPVIYGHSYTLASPGPADVRPPMSPGPWEPGGLPRGSAVIDPDGYILSMSDGVAATFPLRSDLHDGMLARDLTGLGLYTEHGNQTSGFRLQLLLTYTPPPEI